MSIGLAFVIIGVLLIFMFNYSKKINLQRFVKDTEPYARFLMEDDYEFLLRVKYGENIDVNELYSKRVRDGIIITIVMVFLFLQNFSFISLLLAVIIGYVVFKSSYTQLKSYYKNNLYRINLMLPYYLKSLEILIQHYTVPVAL